MSRRIPPLPQDRLQLARAQRVPPAPVRVREAPRAAHASRPAAAKDRPRPAEGVSTFPALIPGAQLVMMAGTTRYACLLCALTARWFTRLMASRWWSGWCRLRAPSRQPSPGARRTRPTPPASRVGARYDRRQTRPSPRSSPIVAMARLSLQSDPPAARPTPTLLQAAVVSSSRFGEAGVSESTTSRRAAAGGHGLRPRMRAGARPRAVLRGKRAPGVVAGRHTAGSCSPDTGARSAQGSLSRSLARLP